MHFSPKTFWIPFPLVSLAFASCLFAQDPGVAASKVVEATLELRASVGNGNRVLFSGQSHFGALSPGVNYVIRLKIKNLSNKAIEFESLKTSCQCGKFVLKEQSIPANSAVNAEVSWLVPTSSPTGDAAISATLYRGNESVASLQLTCQIAGNIFVGDPSFGIRTSDGMVEWKVPIAVTLPVSFDGLTVDLKDGNDGLVVTLERGLETGEDSGIGELDKSNRTMRLGRHWIVLSIHERVVGREFLFGTLTVSDKHAGSKVQKSVMLENRPAITLVPAVLRFRKSADDPFKLSAKALVQVDESLFAPLTELPEGENVELPNAEFSCFLNDEKVEIASKLLGNGVYRIELTINLDSLKDPDAVFEWRVGVGEKLLLVESAFVTHD